MGDHVEYYTHSPPLPSHEHFQQSGQQTGRPLQGPVQKCVPFCSPTTLAQGFFDCPMSHFTDVYLPSTFSFVHCFSFHVFKTSCQSCGASLRICLFKILYQNFTTPNFAIPNCIRPRISPLRYPRTVKPPELVAKFTTEASSECANKACFGL